jgi:hypothetical protein
VHDLITSLTQLLDLMRHYGASRVYAKKLSPNDNSKNQVYLGGGFGALNIIPHGEIIIDTSARAGSRRDRPKAKVRFYWIDRDQKHLAPDANLILYPDYPEVRMSGFLKGCQAAPSAIMTVRDSGRVLFFGTTPDGTVLGYATDAHSPITMQINAGHWEALGVFLELPLDLSQENPKATLLRELRRIYELQWIMSQKLERDGTKKPYSARNGGGYTLEAELGITPNGYSEPDFMGWEIKQYSVSDFVSCLPKTPVTLMTPEPTGGIYKDLGVEAFLRRDGYPDRSGKPDRLNFGGVYTCDKHHHALTRLRMTLNGYDVATGKITNMDGGILLLDQDERVAASWSFKGVMAHWNRKHAQAAYVPSLFRTPPPEYAYGPRVLLCEQTDFILFLEAFATGVVYYDPAIKMEDASTARPGIKRRSQFRMRHAQIAQMYRKSESVSLAT